MLVSIRFMLVVLPTILGSHVAQARDPASYVNHFIGTTVVGHVFTGASVPHGMISVGMDTDSPNNHGGYNSDPASNATGFSQLHQSGTGGSVPLSNFKLWPIASCPYGFETCQTTLNNRKRARKILPDGNPDDTASPGYFSTNLTTGIRVELTSTRRVALHRYTFPSTVKEPRLVIDVTNDGQKSATNPELTIFPKEGRVRAQAEFASSFGPRRYKAYACFTFNTLPSEWGVYKIDYPDLWGTDLQQHYLGHAQEEGGILTFPQSKNSSSTTVLVKVGISLISTNQACRNSDDEIKDWNFERVVKESRAKWNELLGRIQIDTNNTPEETASLLYSSLYRTHLVPADYTGENPHWKSTEPYYDSFYCNWDAYRTLYPLMSLHDPERFANIVRGMIDIQRHEGWLPECREAGTQLYIQGGSNADPILGEFFVKYSNKAKALGVNGDDLYKALLANAESQPHNWNLQGRQADVWRELGYIPSDTTYPGGANTKQVSRTLEHSFGDFAISQVAKVLGRKADAAKYAKRSQNYENVWNSNITVPGAEGFVKGMMQPKFASGKWNFTDPRHCSPNDPDHATCFLNAIRRDGFYETSPIVYSQYVPHDTARLVELQGGAKNFIARLDWIFENNYFDVGNEPAQQIPFMYHYANNPGRSTFRSRQILETHFNVSRNGLPGNDDSGAMGSYVVTQLIGLYPLPATRQFLLSSPHFPSVTFANPVFKTNTTIKVTNWDEARPEGTRGKIYIQKVEVDGKPYKSICYLDWDLFVKGSTIEITLTDNENMGCGSSQNVAPPSLSTGGYD